MKKRIIITACAPIVVCSLAWLAGFDFDKRGFSAFAVGYISFFSAFFAWFIAGSFVKK